MVADENTEEAELKALLERIPPIKPSHPGRFVDIEFIKQLNEAYYKRLTPAEKRLLKLKKRQRTEKKQLRELLREVGPFEDFLIELAVKKWVTQEYAGCGTPIKDIAKKLGMSASKTANIVRLLGIKRARPTKACNHEPDMIREWATKYPKWGTSVAELELDKLLRVHFPRQWRYVSDWQVSIGGKCPDFVHVNRKLIIELFGEWPHLWLKQRHEPGLTKEKAEQERAEHFAAHGYQTLVVWSKELKNEAQLVQKVRDFMRGADVTWTAD